MNNAVTNQIYSKKSQYISLDQIFDMIDMIFEKPQRTNILTTM